MGSLCFIANIWMSFNCTFTNEKSLASPAGGSMMWDMMAEYSSNTGFNLHQYNTCCQSAVNELFELYCLSTFAFQFPIGFPTDLLMAGSLPFEKHRHIAAVSVCKMKKRKPFSPSPWTDFPLHEDLIRLEKPVASSGVAAPDHHGPAGCCGSGGGVDMCVCVCRGVTVSGNRLSPGVTPVDAALGFCWNLWPGGSDVGGSV